MRRMTRHDYDSPGSKARLLEAVLAWADADTDDDVAYHRAEMRHAKAMEAHLLAKGWRPPERPKKRQSVAAESLSFRF